MGHQTLMKTYLVIKKILSDKIWILYPLTMKSFFNSFKKFEMQGFKSRGSFMQMKEVMKLAPYWGRRNGSQQEEGGDH